jgi:ammonia channel protein AmtB
MFYVIKQTVGLRVSRDVEINGIDHYYHGMLSYPEFMDEEPILSGGFIAERAGAD